jgi:hypothetical protein
MEPIKFLRVFLALGAIAAVCAFASGQADQNHSVAQPSRVRKAAPRPMPFPPAGGTSAPVTTLEFLPYERMSRQDHDLEADAESSISERAGFAGLGFNQGKWNYQQVVCPALPNHLFLQFTRNNGAGDVSAFSASIPRSGSGQVRIIPILRRGYSLFSPAPVNALTISAFNHIRAEEHKAESSDWLGTGLCYAALAGAKPQIGPPEETEFHKLPAAPAGREVIPMRGGAIIRFTDVAAVPRPAEWTMTFNGKGRLLKATHSSVSQLGGKVAHSARGSGKACSVF